MKYKKYKNKYITIKNQYGGTVRVDSINSILYTKNEITHINDKKQKVIYNFDLKDITNLSKLIFVDSDYVKIVSSLTHLQLSNLNSLNIDFSNFDIINDAYIKLLANSIYTNSIIQMPNLQDFTLRINNDDDIIISSDEGVKALANSIAQLNDLNFLYLDLTSVIISNDGEEKLMNSIVQLVKLEHLFLTHTINDINKLAFNLKNLSDLIILDLNNNNISDTDVKVLAPNFEYLTKLQNLDLGNNNISDTGIEALALHFKYLTKLQVLILVNNNISDTGVKALAPHFEYLTKLQFLALDNNNISDIGVKALAPHFKYLTKLEDLQFPSNNIGDNGATILADSFQFMPKLKYLDLENNKIGNEGALALAESFPLISNLRYLSLNKNKIGDKGAIALAEKLKSTLRGTIGATDPDELTLNLSENIIGEECVKYLIQLNEDYIKITVYNQIIHICIPNVNGSHMTIQDCEYNDDTDTYYYDTDTDTDT
jgi:Ran GTPase-activating protein (RanGAP) involved in mRNA processing and transport